MGYSPFPITVDGQSLDTFGWAVDVKTRPWAATINGDIDLPGTDGVVASLNDDLDATALTLSMWALGTDDTGVVPGGTNAQSQVRANLDHFAFLFSTRHRLIDVRETVNAAGDVRQCYGKRVEAVSPEVTAGIRAKFAVTLKVPTGVWQDVNTADWSQTGVTTGNTYEVTSLAGGTSWVDDAVITFTGPATNPQLTDFASGAYVRLNASLAAGQVWRINCGSWSTRYGSGLSLTSADADGTAGDMVTVSGGGNARLLRCVPYLSGGVRRVSLTVGGSGFSSATAVAVRARRKWLQ